MNDAIERAARCILVRCQRASDIPTEEIVDIIRGVVDSAIEECAALAFRYGKGLETYGLEHHLEKEIRALKGF